MAEPILKTHLIQSLLQPCRVIQLTECENLATEIRSFPTETQIRAFPTAQAQRQKARKKAGIPVQKRKRNIEQHRDDCGTDLSCLQLDATEKAQVGKQMKEEEEHFVLLGTLRLGILCFIAQTAICK